MPSTYFRARGRRAIHVLPRKRLARHPRTSAQEAGVPTTERSAQEAGEQSTYFRAGGRRAIHGRLAYFAQQMSSVPLQSLGRVEIAASAQPAWRGRMRRRGAGRVAWRSLLACSWAVAWALWALASSEVHFGDSGLGMLWLGQGSPGVDVTPCVTLQN